MTSFFTGSIYGAALVLLSALTTHSAQAQSGYPVNSLSRYQGAQPRAQSYRPLYRPVAANAAPSYQQPIYQAAPQPVASTPSYAQPASQPGLLPPPLPHYAAAAPAAPTYPPVEQIYQPAQQALSNQPSPQFAPQPQPVRVIEQAPYQPMAAGVQTTDEPWYLAGRIGAGFLSDWDDGYQVNATTQDSLAIEFNTGVTAGFAAGVRVHPNVRIEADLGYMNHDVDQFRAVRRVSGVVTNTSTISGDDSGFEAYSLMGNLFLDYPIPGAEQIVPYIGAGVGGLFQRNGAEEENVAYQGMAGVNYDLNGGQTFLGLGYRYLQSPDMFDDDQLQFDIESHAVELSLRQHF